MKIGIQRKRNADWNLHSSDDTGNSFDTATLQCFLLNDIREELKAIKHLLQCHRIPTALDALARMDRLGVKRRVVKKRKK